MQISDPNTCLAAGNPSSGSLQYSAVCNLEALKSSLQIFKSNIGGTGFENI
jgi:hypothetical protein